MKETSDIDKLFKRKLREYTEDPPTEVWDSLKVHLISRRKIHFRLIIYRIAAGIAILLATGIGWYLSSLKTGKIELTDLNKIEIDSEYYKIIADSPDTIIKGDASMLSEISSDIKSTITPEEIWKHNTDSEKDKEIFAETVIADDNNADRETIINPQFETLVHDSKTTAFSSERHEDSQRPSVSVHPLIGKNIYRITPQGAVKDTVYALNGPKYLDKGISAILPDDNNNESISEERRWSLSGIAAPEYSYRAVRNGVMASERYFNDSEKALITWSGGLQLGYQATKRFNIQTGLLFSRSGLTVAQLRTFGRISVEEVMYLYDSPSNNEVIINAGNSIGNIKADQDGVKYLSYNSDIKNSSADLIDMTSEVQNINPTIPVTGLDAVLLQYLDFIEVPVNLRYKVNTGKMSFNFLCGFSSNVLTGNKVIFKTEEERREAGKTENIRNVCYSGNLGFSLDYGLSEQVIFMIEPRYKYYLHSINEDRLITTRPYMIGVFTGIRYKF